MCGDGNVQGSEQCDSQDMCCDTAGGTCTWESALEPFSGDSFSLIPDSCMTSTEYYTLASLDDDLVAWFRFEGDSTERKKNDGSSGQNISGENTGTYIDNGGKYGGAYSFPGGSSKGLEFNDGDLPMVDSPRTISGWVKYVEDCGGGTATGYRQVMFGYGHTNVALSGMYVGREDDGRVSLGLVSGNYMRFGNEGDLCNLNNWYHLAITYDGQIFKAYIDGANLDCTGGSEGNTICDTTDFTLLTDSNTAIIGSRNFQRTMNGTIDEVLVFSRALTDAEIKSLYDSSQYEYSANLGSGAVDGYLVESSAKRPAEIRD